MDEVERRELAEMLARLAEAAGRIILARRAAGATFARKPDGSPVSDADLHCEAFLLEDLGRALPHVPVVSEESAAGRAAPSGPGFLLVDPLDGTREFAAGNNDFTINLALVEDGAATLGVVHAPAHGRLFMGFGPGEAWERRPAEGTARRIGVRRGRHEVRALASRSHGDAVTASLLARFAPAETRRLGSAIKFGLIAADEADLYPRFGPTMAWDTAAGQAVLEAAGGAVLAPDRTPLRYGAADFRNSSFVAAASRALAERALDAVEDRPIAQG